MASFAAGSGAAQRQKEKEQLQRTIAQSQQRTIKTLVATEGTVHHTNELLAEQGELIDRVQARMDDIHGHLDYSEEMMRQLESPWNFRGRAKESKRAFEETYGGVAEWSGKLFKRGHGLFGSGFQERFCAVRAKNMYYFADHRSVTKPKGTISLFGASVRFLSAREERARKFAFELIDGRSKKRYVFAAPTHNEMEGWVKFIEMKIGVKSYSEVPGGSALAGAGAGGGGGGGNTRRKGKGRGGQEVSPFARAGGRRAGPRGGHGQTRKAAGKAAHSAAHAGDAPLNAISGLLSNIKAGAELQRSTIAEQDAKLDRLGASMDAETARIEKLNLRQGALLGRQGGKGGGGGAAASIPKPSAMALKGISHVTTLS